MAAIDRYTDNLKNPRSPGTGCHSWIMSTANLGTFAGLSGDKIFNDIRKFIPSGNRRIPNKEIGEAIQKALSDYRGSTFTPRSRPAPVVKDGKTPFRRLSIRQKSRLKLIYGNQVQYAYGRHHERFYPITPNPIQTG